MIQSTLNALASSVLLFKDKEQELFFEFAYGPAGKALRRTRLNTISGIAGWVARTGKPVIVNDVTKDQRFDKTFDLTTGFVTKSLICVPLIINHQVIGVIEVLNKLNGDDFIEQDLETMVSLAPTAAMLIETTKLYKFVQKDYDEFRRDMLKWQAVSGNEWLA